MRLWFPESVLLSVICCVRLQHKALDYSLECAQQQASVLWERCVCVCVGLNGSVLWKGKCVEECSVVKGERWSTVINFSLGNSMKP